MVSTPKFKGPSSIAPLQFLRAVAAIGVMAFHFSQPKNEMPAFPLGAIGVDIFFVISGFVMVFSSRSLFGQAGARWKFISRRLARIVPLYWLCSAVLLAHIFISYHNLAAVNLDVRSVISSFLFLPAIRVDHSFFPVLAVGWTLNLEMLFYAVFAAFIGFNLRNAVVASASVIIALVCAGPFLTPTLRLLANPIMLNFIIGMALGAVFLERQLQKNAFWGWTLWIVAGGLAALGSATQGSLVAGVIATMLVTGGVLIPATTNSRFWKIAMRLGDASYAIYLIHTIAGAPRHLPGTATHPIVFGIFKAALVIIAALIINRWFEVPQTTWLRARFERRRTPKAVVSPDGVEPSAL